MTEETYQARISKRTKEEFEEFERDPIAQRQKELDFWWEQKLAHKAAMRRRIERPGSTCPEAGIYDPFARLKDEQ